MAERKRDSGSDERDAEVLRSIERERLRALVTGDVERAGQLHSDDFQGSGRSCGRMRPLPLSPRQDFRTWAEERTRM